MDIDLNNILPTIGNWISELTQGGLSLLNSAGIIMSPVTAKILSILVILGIIWIVCHFMTFLKTPIKVLIIVLGVILIVSILVTFV